MQEYTASNIGFLVDACVAISRQFRDSKPWWRGQANIEWSVRPSLYRRGFESKENNINSRFRLMARARYNNCPSQNDAFSWLFLMQHYGLPTRLLDWSESPLIALFFALGTEQYDDRDAAIWALSPMDLNLQESKASRIFSPGSKDLRQLGYEAFVINRDNPDTRLLALLTEQFDPRHMMQQSVFTIHGRSSPLNELPEASNYMAKIRIPKEAKQAFRQILDLFGISRHVLFPDLENLARELSALEFIDEPTPSTGFPPS